AVLCVSVPSLRERKEDIPLLVEAILDDDLGGDRVEVQERLAQIGESTWTNLANHAWPGNVRELRNVIERALALGDDSAWDHLMLARKSSESWTELDLNEPYRHQEARLLQRFAREYLLGQLEKHQGNISKASRASGLERTRFKRMVRKYVG